MSAAALPFAPPPDARRGERAGLIAALALHVALLGALSLRWGAAPAPPPPAEPEPITVSLVKDVAPTATAPPAPEPPAPSIAPNQGEPEDAAPAPTPAPKPEPVKPKPEAKAVSEPEPKPVPAKAEPKPEPKPEPAKAEPKPKAAPVKPAPAAKAEKAPAKPAEKPADKPVKAAARPSRLAGLGQELAAGAKADARQTRGHRLGADFLSGLAADAPARHASAAAPAAKAGPFPAASIVQAIQRQIQPCADRQVNPGPGANQIVTTLLISLNQDGTLAATPRMVRQAGKTDENERYAQRVAEMGIAAFKGCTPLKLPAEYYSTASGGWNSINYRWQLK